MTRGEGAPSVPRVTSSARHVLIAGGGFAALEALAALRHHAGDLVRVTLLAPERELVYRPTSVLAPFGARGGETFALAGIVEDFGAELRAGALDLVEPDAHRVVTQDRGVLGYDELVVAVGARTRPAVDGAITFRGPSEAGAVRRAVLDLAARRRAGLALVVPPGTRWAVPIVELALFAAHRAPGGRVDLVTPERTPLELFGPGPAAVVTGRLSRAGVRIHPERVPSSFDGRRLWLGLDEGIDCDVVVAGARLTGPAIGGLPHDRDGFLPVDDRGRVTGTDVHAAGDGTDVPYKHGGIAAHLADVVARGIAARAGAEVEEQSFRPVLRAMLATPEGPLFLRRDTDQADGEVSPEALWWPPVKVAAPHLASYLADRHDHAGNVFTTSQPQG